METNTNNRLLSIDYLRGFLTALVVLHHALLGYTSHGILSLIIDPNKFPFFDNIVGLQDTYFMFLFFLISGIFTLDSIKKKGTINFIKKRLVRLGIPFLIGWLIINMPAYFLSVKAYVNFVLHTDISFPQFIKHWINTQKMATAGHLWFLWVLLLFNIITAIFYSLKIKISKDEINNQIFSNISPIHFLLVFFVSGFILFSLFAKLNENRFYVFWGPFMAQVNRLPLYFLFFIIGVLLGKDAVLNGVFSKKSKLVRYWWVNGIIGIVFWRNLYIPQLYNGNLFLYLILTASFVLASIFLSITLLGIFVSYFNNEVKILNSLKNNAYGIYIVHYSFVAFFQYLFLYTDLPGVIEGLSVFILSLLFSWYFTYLIRTIPVVRKVIG